MSDRLFPHPAPPAVSLNPLLRTVGRLLLALVLMLLGLMAAVIAMAVTGGLHWSGVCVASILLLLGYLGLGVAGGAGARLRPMRLTLAAASLVSVYLLLSLPWPPGRAEMGSLAILGGGVALSIAAVLLAERFPRVTLALLALLAASGLLMLARLTYALAVSPYGGSPPGPAVVLSFVIAMSVGAAWIAALWHARFLLRPRTDRVDPAGPRSLPTHSE